MSANSEKTFDPFLYPFRRKPCVDLDIVKDIAVGTMFPIWIIQCLHSMTIKNFEMVTPIDERPLALQRNYNVYNSVLTSNMSKFNISFERPKPMDTDHEKPKQKDLSKLNTIHTELSFERLNPTVISQERPPMDIFKRPIPQDVAHESLSKMSPYQERLDKVPLKLKVAMGVVSGMVATTVVHPLDVIKVNLQLFPKKVTTLGMLRRIKACEGLGGLYAGLTAGWLRQVTYTGARLYIYNSLFEEYRREHGELPLFPERLRHAVVAGLIGAFVGTPSEVALVRMIEVSRKRRSPCSPRCSVACKHVPYPESAIPQLIRIARREGIHTWWRGCIPTLIRSIFVTSSQVGAYYELKKALEWEGHIPKGLELHACTAFFSSFVATCISLPIDQVKTRYQSIREKMNHVDILRDIMKKKGFKYLWKGFIPYYIRQFSHTVITYVLLDQFIDGYIELVDVRDKK